MGSNFLEPALKSVICENVYHPLAKIALKKLCSGKNIHEKLEDSAYSEFAFDA